MQRTQRRYDTRFEDRTSEIDRQIIARLQADGRRPFTQIAAELDMSEAAVRARANRLINDGLLQIVGVVDPQRLGFGLLALIGMNCEASRLLDVAAAVSALPETVRVVVTAGTFDVLVETACEDHQALLELMTNKLGAIEGVQATHTFVYLHVAKNAHEWTLPG